MLVLANKFYCHSFCVVYTIASCKYPPTRLSPPIPGFFSTKVLLRYYPELISLLLASGASLRLTFYARPPPPTDNEVMLYPIMLHWKGGHNRERKCRILCISPPPASLCSVLMLRLQKGGGGRICGTLR